MVQNLLNKKTDDYIEKSVEEIEESSSHRNNMLHTLAGNLVFGKDNERF